MKVRRAALAGLCVVGQLGCSERVDEPAPGVLGSDSEQMFSRITYEGDPATNVAVSPFSAAYTERAMFFNRAMASSTSFRACFFNTANDYYQYQPGDPNPTASHDSQVLSAWNSLQQSDDALRFDIYDQPRAGASAGGGSPTEYSTRTINLANGFRADYGDWANCWCTDHCELDTSWACWSTATHLNGGTRQRFQPWNWISGTMMHEYMHTQGYGHLGVVHAPNDGGDDSINYIITDCAYAVVAQSDRQCDDHAGHGIMHNSACAANQLRLLSGWSGTRGTAQTSSSCECVSDPLHQVTLATTGGMSLTAEGGGGPSARFRTNWSSGLGAWQDLYVRATGARGVWAEGSPVEVKVFNGQFGTATFGASGSGLITASDYWRFTNLSYPGQPIAPGNLVSIRSAAGWWAIDDGTAVAATATAPAGAASWFKVLEPTRTLVYVQSQYNSLFLTSATPALVTRRTASDLRYATQLNPAPAAPDQSRIAAQADAAYWLIDWNGGDLRDGDDVSFQVFRRDTWAFLSTLHGTGQLGESWSGWTDETFTLHDTSVPVGAVVRHGDVITLKSRLGRYLSANTGGSGAPVDTSQATEGPLTRFALDFVHLYDFDRSAAW